MDKHLRLEFIKPGLQTTIQDAGRDSARGFGVPKSGPMDLASAKLANWLVGNPKTAPLFEITMLGPVIQLDGQGQLAFTGAPFVASLDNKSIPFNTSIELNGRHLLTVGKAKKGCRCYLAFAGSWKLRSWLGSCSTATQNGNVLTPDSVIKKGTTISVSNNHPLAIRSVSRPWIKQPRQVIRVLAGPEYNTLSAAAIKELLGRQFTISHQSNRMGYRIDTALTNYSSSVEVISSGVVPGTVQVTHTGQLIILMADAQTSGGYPRIANVISADQDKLAQMKPGDSFRFQLVSLKSAYQALGI